MSRRLQLLLPRDVGAEGLAALLLRAHGALARPRLGSPERLAIELAHIAGRVQLALWCERPRTSRVLADAVRVLLPGGAIEPDGAELPDAALAHVGRVVLGRRDAPLRTDLPAPGLAGVLGVLGGLSAGAEALVQLVLTPAPGAPGALLRQAARSEQAGRRRSWADTLVAAQVNRHRARAMREKAATPLFRVVVTVAASSPGMVADLAGSFEQFSGPYGRVRRQPVLLPGLVRRQVRRRALPIWGSGLANVGELAAMLTPSPELLRAVGGPVVASRRISAPADAARRGRVLCVSDDGRGERPVALRRADARLHTFLIGPTGAGKSWLMGGQVLAAIADGDGAVLLDPKGDLVEDVLRRLPEERADDVIVVDPVRDRAHPVGLNLLDRSGGQDAAAVTDAVVGTMRDLYARNWGARTDDTLYNGVFTAAALAGATLADLPRLYESPAFREPFLAVVSDPFIRDFWCWFDALTPGERGTIVAPVLNKLRPLLRPDLAPIIGQPRSTIDLSRVLGERRILLVRLPRDGALFGALLVARLWSAASRRVELPEAARPDVLLAIDEVHAFLRTGGDVGEMLAMARGLRLSLCVATQHLEQCPPPLRAALLANARTRVCFQADASDAATLARGFAPELEAADLTGLGRYEVACRMAINGAVSRPFTGRTLPLPDPVRPSSEPLRAASRARYGTPRASVEAAIRKRLETGEADLSEIEIGRRPAP